MQYATIPVMLQFLPLWWLASGFLFGISFVYSSLWFCFLFGLTIFYFAIGNTLSLYKLFFWGTLVGTMHYGGALLWYFDTFPVKWLAQDEALIQFSVIGIYLVATSLVMGLSTGLFALCVKAFLPRRATLLLMMPFVWLCFQILAAFFFSLYSLGPGGTLNISFGFGQIGYLLAESTYFIPFAKIFGVYGLTYLGSLLATLLYIYVNNKLFKKKIVNILVLVCILCLYVISYIITPEYISNGQKVIAVETYFDKTFSSQINYEKYKSDHLLQATSLALSKNPDVIILPEDSRFTQHFTSSDEIFAWVKEQNEIFKGVIVDSGRTYDSKTSDTVLRAYIYDVENTSVSSLDKQYLVPQGEFLAYLHGKVISLLVSEKVYKDIVESLPYRKGMLKDSQKISSELPAVLFCFESVSPFGLQNALSARHPSFVAHVVSHAWFTNPTSLWYQINNMLKVQVVWNNVPMVSAGNMSPSKLYLPTGEIEEGQTLVEEKLWSLKLFEL